MSKAAARRRRGLAVLALAVALGGRAIVVEAQEFVDGGGLLSCGGLTFAAASPAGTLVSVAEGTQVSVLGQEVTMPCAGPLAASFTAELSGPIGGSLGLVTIVAQCVQTTASPGGCMPGESVVLVPPGYRIPLLHLAGLDARTVAAGAMLPAGRYSVNALVGAQADEVVVGKATLVVVTGGTFPARSTRDAGLPTARPAEAAESEGSP